MTETKKTKRPLFFLTLCLTALVLLLSACGPTPAPDTLWDAATYTEDTEIGEGALTVLCDVTAGERTVRLTVHTDIANLADALKEAGVIDGEEGPYGLYVKTVNGITADYDVDASWWMLTVDGEMSMSSASDVTVEEGVVYAFVYAH